jgi:hypothetical protein
MLPLNETKLAAVVDAALMAVKDDRKWTNAILRAEKLLTSGNPYIHFTGDALLMLSDSGEIYTANGTCQCVAFKGGSPCKHRAAYKLAKRYMEAV